MSLIHKVEIRCVQGRTQDFHGVGGGGGGGGINVIAYNSITDVYELVRWWYKYFPGRYINLLTSFIIYNIIYFYKFCDGF